MRPNKGQTQGLHLQLTTYLFILYLNLHLAPFAFFLAFLRPVGWPTDFAFSLQLRAHIFYLSS